MEDLLHIPQSSTKEEGTYSNSCMHVYIILHLIQAISDWHMIILILTIATVMAVIIAVGFAIPQVLPSPLLVDDNEHRSGFNVCCSRTLAQ